LDKFAVKDKAGVIDWKQTAKNLVDSLNHLVSDDVDVTEVDGKKVETVVKANDLSTTAQAEIVAWFEEIGKTETTAKGMANELLKADFTPDDKIKKGSMFDFLILHGNDAGGYDYQSNGEMLNLLITMISSFSPQLGQVFSNLVQGMGIVAERPEDADTRNSLELAWEVVMHGREQDIAELSGYDIDDDSITYNNFKGPSNALERAQFFDGTWREGSGFDLGHGTEPFETRSFKNMVLQPLLDSGVIKITDNSLDADGNSIVEGETIQLAKQLMLGGQMGEKFSSALIDSKMLKFDGMSVAEISKFKAEFTQHLEGIDMSVSDSSWKAGKSILDFVNGRAGVEFNAAVSREDLLDVIDPYSKSTGPADFAERFQKYANDIKGVHVGLDVPEQERVSTNVADIKQLPNSTNDKPVPAEVAAAKPVHQQTKHEDVSAPGSGAVSQNENGDIEIGGDPAKVSFNHCAAGTFAIPCLPDGPKSVPDLIADTLAQKQGEPSNYVMASSGNGFSPS
jgi:hypothetical protein